MKLSATFESAVVMENFRSKYHFSLTVITVLLLCICQNTTAVFSLLYAIEYTQRKKTFSTGLKQRLTISAIQTHNVNFTLTILRHTLLICTVLFCVSPLLIILSGDVHPNPGPDTHNSASPNTSISSSISSIDMSRHISFVHYNVQSILPKLDILYTELRDFDILAFSETWLSPSTSTSDLLFSSFHSPERKDRREDNHGGVLLYIRDTHHYRRRQDLETPNVECIWIEITLHTKTLLFGLFYRPPNTNSFQHSNIVDSIHLAVDTGIENIIVTGDFNLNIKSQQCLKKVESLCRKFSLSQTICESTHFTESSESIIDLIFTSNTNLIPNSGVGDPFLQQDVRYHCPIFGLLNFKSIPQTVITRHVWLYDKGNYNLLRSQAEAFNWNTAKDNDINIYAENITNSISTLSGKCIPNRKVTIRSQEPQWITTEIKRLIRKRKRAYRKAKQTNSNSDWTKFRTLRNKTISSIRDSKTKHLNRQVDKLKSTPKSTKKWWSCLKSFIKPSANSTSTIPPLAHSNQIISDSYHKANLLNEYFTSQSRLDEPSNPVFHDCLTQTHPSIDNITITPQDVIDVLQTLDVSKASGPSGISNRILKELSLELSVPLSDLFNYSLSKGYYPESWREANVTPLFKSGDQSSVKNYRPISLLDNIGKVFEKIMFKSVFNHILKYNLLTPMQSGFVPGDTTVNQLVYLLDLFTKSVDSGKEVRVVFCDISKAFDRVWHKGLLHKLKAFGISGNLLSWFSSYLSNRKQRVVLPGTHSEWDTVSAGVPQGSILGPLLFLIYINDIVTDINANIRLFADDTGLSIIVENPVSAAETLNSDLNTISIWARQWLVAYNPSKTKSLVISRKTLKPIHPPLYMFDEEITEVDNHKHLGIFLSNDLRWSSHIDYISTKAYQRINILRKLKFTLDRRSLETIYISFIRPVLEYSNVLFDNCSSQERDELERIQYEAARIVTGTTKLVSITKLMSEVGWETLTNRRKKHKLILFYKMKSNLTPDYLSSLVPDLVADLSQYNLRNSNSYQTPFSRTNLYRDSFLPSVIRDFNNLPQELRDAPALSTFKRLLYKDKQSVPKHFLFGERKHQILHTRLRTNCSNLAHDLYTKNIVNSPHCQCGEIETCVHFFLNCPQYANQRHTLCTEISKITPVSIKVILHGDISLPYEKNVAIFSAVHKFISKTKRFVDA